MAARAVAGKTTPRGRTPGGRASAPARMVRRDEPSATPASIPVLRLSSDDVETPVWKPLFYIDDDEYCVWANPPQSVGVEALAILADGKPYAEHRANRWLLDTMLGEDGHAALRAYQGLKTAQYNHVLKVCTDLAFGAMEDPKTPSGRG